MSATDSIVKAAAGTGVDAAAAEQSLKKGYPHEPLATRSLDFNPVHWYEAVEKHWRGGTLNYPMGIYITLCHYWALIGCARLTSVSAPTLLWAYVLWPITGLGITAGVHRLWSHRSYTAGPFLRCLLMLMNSIANQGSIYHWARDHRVHHKHSETPADPHNATRGFFFAHMGWLYVKKDPSIHIEGKKLDFSDLARDPFVTFQKALDPWFALFMCFVFPGLVAKFGWGEDFWNALWVAGALRYVVVLHATWMVNSAAHLFGDHREAAAIVSGPGRLNGGVEREQVGLAGNVLHVLGHRLQLSSIAVEIGNGAQQLSLAAAGGMERRGHFVQAVLCLTQAAGHTIAADHVVRLAQGLAEPIRQSSKMLEQLAHAVLLDVAHLPEVLVPGW